MFELIIISACTIPVVLICHRLKISVIVGFLLTGVLINPKFGIFRFMDQHTIHILSEVGIICLLFTIGLEFSITKIKSMRDELLIGGGVQVFGTLGVIALIAIAFALPVNQAIFLGCLIAISSTALKLSILQNKGAVNTAYGQVSVAVTIFQDIAAVIMIILVPLFAGESGGQSLIQIIQNLVIKFLIVIVVSAIFHTLIVPKMLYYVAKTQSRELFVVTVFFIFTSIVGLTGYLGISIALGAFIAGVLISESQYSHRAHSVIMPFKDIFTSIFFVSQGMMLDLSFALANLHYLLLIAIAIIIIKLICATIAVSLVRGVGFVSFMASVYLAQISEFSFVLFQEGSKYSLMGQQAWNFFLGASIITMLLSPSMVDYAPAFFEFIKKWLVKFNIKLSGDVEGEEEEILEDHLIIVGYGIVGRRVAYGAKLAGIKYIVIEMNPDTVKKEQENGIPIIYGDATEDAVLEQVKIESAKAIVITIPNIAAASSIVSLSYKLNENAYILVRSRFDLDSQNLLGLGAKDVIIEENEVSYEMLSQLLKHFMIPVDSIDNIMFCQKNEDTESLGTRPAVAELSHTKSEHNIYAIRVPKNSPLIGKSLMELDLRKNYGVLVIMIKRGDTEIVNMDSNEKIMDKDILVTFGSKTKINDFIKKSGAKKPESENVI